MRRLAYLLAGLLLLAMTSRVRAGLIVSIADQGLSPGGTGFVDVSIRSDTGADVLDTFGLEFQITTSGTTRLEFVAPPPDPQLTDPGYLLFGDSTAALFPPAGSVSTNGSTNDTYIGGDGTLSTLGVLVPTTDRLLVRLQVTAATGNAPGDGDTFTISLVSPSPFVFFNDPFFNPLDFSSTPGTVTMREATSDPGSIAPMPVPPGLVLAGIGTLGLLSYRWCRRKNLMPRSWS